MEEQTVYLVDDDAKELRANRRDLETIFEGSPVRFKGVQPFKQLTEYDSLLPRSDTAAFLIDQRLQVSGVVTYSGIELASHLRSISTKLPIYILTNYGTDPGVLANEQTIEEIIEKDDLTNPHDHKAVRFKARFLRRLQGFRDVLTAREQRFRDLLMKSLKENLSASEKEELENLESERLLPVHSAELKEIDAMENTIQELQKLLRRRSSKPGKRTSRKK